MSLYVNRYGYGGFQNPQPITSTMSPFEVSQIDRKLGGVVEAAAQSIGTITSSNGDHVCCGLLVGIDRLLVPIHVVSEICPSDIKVHFLFDNGEICIPKNYDVLRFVESNLELDYCILQLAQEKDGCYPGDIFPIPDISTSPNDNNFFLIHTNGKEGQVVSFGKPCRSNYGQQDFCSYITTFSGSSGGICFDLCGRVFAMHVGRYTGACGQSRFERKALFLKDVCNQSRILSCFDKYLPLCQSRDLPRCMPMIEFVDSCVALEKHGSLQPTFISKEEIFPIPKKIVEYIVDFFKSFKSLSQKKELYSKFWGSIGTIYNLGAARLDRQSPLTDATNLQVQVGSQTIATILISNELHGYDDSDAKISEVVKYVIFRFIGAVNHAKHRNEAIVILISPKT